MSKLQTKVDDKQLEELYKALRGGAPLLLALQYANISRATYYYWVAMASIVEEAKSQAELEQIEKVLHSGISIQDVKDASEQAAAQKRTGVGAFIEPSQESLLQYKNSRKFRNFADECYSIVNQCNRIRSEIALEHLEIIKTSRMKTKASGSMWYLERTMSDFFAKPSEKAIDSGESKPAVEKIRVEYVDPDSKETQDRVKAMEEDLIKAINGEGSA